MKSLGLINATLDECNVLITGGGTGIGYATALLFLKMGASVSINFLPNDFKSETSIKLLKEKYKKVFLSPGDVSIEEEAINVVNKSKHTMGEINYLINNVGISLTDEPIPFERLDLINSEFWEKMISVNLMSAFFCSKASENFLKEKGGAIVNVSSITSNGKRGTSIPYSASKAALESLTISLAKSFAPKVRVNAISPGFTRTEMTENRSNEHKERMAKQTLLNRIAQPEEMAEVIFFLCVSGSYITGEIISVNGGNGYNYNT